MEINKEKEKFMILSGAVSAVVITGIDAFFASEYSLAMSKCIFMAVFFSVLALIKLKDKVELTASLYIAGIFLSAGLVVYALPYFNNLKAQSSAGEIIKALESYKARNGFYPAKLETLKPEFIGKMPKAKYTVLWNSFYLLDGSLVYVNEPPFNLMKYDFTRGKWSWCGSEAFGKILALGRN